MKIKTNKEEFADIVLIFLYERLKNMEDENYSDKFYSILNDMKLKGLEPKLRKYFLDTNVITRNKYRFIRNTFEGTAVSDSTIIISNGENNE